MIKFTDQFFYVSSTGDPFRISSSQSGSTVELFRLDSSGTMFLRSGTSTTNTNGSKLVVGGTVSETVGGVQYKLLSSQDISLTSATSDEVIGTSLLCSATASSTTLTVPAESIGLISVNDVVSGPGLPPGTTVTAKGASSVTLSDAAIVTTASRAYTFYRTNKLLSPGSVGNQVAKAWVTFDGSTTPPTVLAGHNVSSVSRSSTGIFVINFVDALPHENYLYVGNGIRGIAGNNCFVSASTDLSKTESLCTIRTVDSSGTVHNPPFVSVWFC